MNTVKQNTNLLVTYYINNGTMKTTITALLISLMTIPALAGMDNPPAGLALEDEANVNDIPFNTNEVVMSLGTEMAEEAYVNDIPFNTTDVVLLAGVTIEEEAEVDDFAFNTEEILAAHGLSLAAEDYVNDIPFDTYDVLLLSNIIIHEEEEVDDIPFDTECIVHSVMKDGFNWSRCMIPFDGKTMILETTYNHHAPESLDPRLF